MAEHRHRSSRIVSDSGAFNSPTLQAGDRFSFTFENGGTFKYHDAFETADTGTVVVNPQPQPPPSPPTTAAAQRSVSLSAAGSVVVFGGGATLSGSISSKEPGENVTIVARRFGQSSFAPIATVTTGSGGIWDYVARPTILTTYQANWSGATSSSSTLFVRPGVAFRVLAGHRFFTRVTAGRSFAGRMVNFHRRSLGRWVTCASGRARRRSSARPCRGAPTRSAW